MPGINPWWHDTPNQVPPSGGEGNNDSGGDFPRGDTGPNVIKLSNTLLGEIIPVTYGSIRVVGRIGFWDLRSSYLYLGIVFGFGEDAGATAAQINEETGPAGIGVGTIHDGDGSSSVSTYLTSATGWVAADTTQWQGFNHLAIRCNTRTSKLPGGLVVSVKTGGKLVTPIGGGTATATTNPATIAYDILSNAELGGLSTDQLGDESFQAVEEFSGEDTGDGKARYAFVGTIDQRDPFKAAAQVLKNCNGYLYTGADGKTHCWAEMLPPLITGTWTSTGTGGSLISTMAEDSSSGAATTELEIGQTVVHDDLVGIVYSVTDDDTFEVRWLTVIPSTASLPVRAGGVKSIGKNDWIEPPAMSERSVNNVPDVVKVTFNDEDRPGSRHSATVSYGSSAEKISNMHIDCTDASHAVRAVKTKLLVNQLEPFFWAGRVPADIGAYLSPGDVITINTDLVTDQPVTVQQPITINQDGSYTIKLREFDVGAFSNDTEVTDTVPGTGTAWDSSMIPIISEIRYEYSGSEYDMISGSGGVTTMGNTSRSTLITGTYAALPNNVALEAKETGGTIRQAIKMDSSNRLTLGDGNTPVYLNASTSGGILVPDDVPITAGWTVDTRFIFWKYNSSGNEHVCGNNTSGSPQFTIKGIPIELDSSGAIALTGYARFKGYQSYAGDPTSGTFNESGAWGVWKNTSNGNVYFVFNDGGTIKKGQLT